MWTSKRALVPRRQGTGRQTTCRSFAVTSEDFDCLAGTGPGNASATGAKMQLQHRADVRLIGEVAAATAIAPTAAAPPAATGPAEAEAPTVFAAGVLHAAPQTPVSPAVVVQEPSLLSNTAGDTVEQLPQMPAIDRPQHMRGTGRLTKRYNMALDISLLEAAEQHWQAEQAAAAEAEAARLSAIAEAEALRLRVIAEAEAAAKAEAEAAAAKLAAAEAALAAAEAEAAAITAAIAAAEKEEARAAAEAEAAARAAEVAAIDTAAEASAEQTPATAKAARAAATPATARSLRSGWSPVEGVPEMHTRPRTVRRAAPAAATPGPSLKFTPLEGVPETARGFCRQTTASKGNASRKAAFTPVEGVPEKDVSFQRTPFDKQLRQAQLTADLEAGAAASSPTGSIRVAGRNPAAATASEQTGSDAGGVGEGGMAEALQQVDSLVAGITSASPNTPLTQLPVHLLSAARTRAAAAAAAAAAQTPTVAAAVPPSVLRVQANKPGHMDVALQWSAPRMQHTAAQQRAAVAVGVSNRVKPATAASTAAAGVGAASAVAAAPASTAAGAADGAVWDDDGDEYAGAGGDYSDWQDDELLPQPVAAAAAAAANDSTENAGWSPGARLAAGVAAVAAEQQQQAASAAAAASPIPRLTPEYDNVQHRAPANAAAAAAAATAEPDSGEDAVANRPRAPKRSYKCIATPREGRMAKARKSLAGDGLAVVDGRRVSTRQRQKPMEFWRNERAEYERDHRSLPTVQRYVAVTPDPMWPAPSTQQERKVRKEKQEQKQQAEAAAAASSASRGGSRSKGRPAGKGKKAKH